MDQSNNNRIYGTIAIILGVLLVMGASAFLLTTSLMTRLPRFFLIPPLVQLSLGVVGIISGAFVFKGNRYAWYILAIVPVGVIINAAFLIVLFLSGLPLKPR